MQPLLLSLSAAGVHVKYRLCLFLLRVPKGNVDVVPEICKLCQCIPCACSFQHLCAAIAVILLQACGTEGSPCCIAPNNNGFVEGTCKNGLTCIPGTTTFGSKAMFDKFTGGYQGAMRDTTVTGTCRKATACNTAYNPCGKAAGVSCAR